MEARETQEEAEEEEGAEEKEEQAREQAWEEEAPSYWELNLETSPEIAWTLIAF